MSIESMTIALHHSRAVGTPKVVLLGIANHDGDGGSWPSVATLTKYAGVSRGNVQKAISRLEELGEIRRYVQDGGTASMLNHLRPNRYEVTLRCPPGCDRSRSHNVGSADHVAFDPTERAGEFIEGPWGIASEAPRGIADEAPPRIASEALTVLSEPSMKHPVDRSGDRSRPDASATERQRRYLRHMVATIGEPWACSDAEIDGMTARAADGAIQAFMGDYRRAGGGQVPPPWLRAGEPF